MPSAITGVNCIQSVFSQCKRQQSKVLKKFGFTPCKGEQPLGDMELQEKEAQKDYSTYEISLERTHS